MKISVRNVILYKFYVWLATNTIIRQILRTQKVELQNIISYRLTVLTIINYNFKKKTWKESPIIRIWITLVLR